MQIGMQTTLGSGAGAVPDVGKKSAQENIDDVMKRIGDTKLLFICAGLGGGTGTGASPVIAAEAKKRGILTIALVYTPFEFEGQKRSVAAEEGLKLLEQSVDSLIIVENEKLFERGDEFKHLPIQQAFKAADDIMLHGLTGITDIILKPGLINLDFADIKTVVSSGGRSFLGTAFGIMEGDTTEALQNVTSAIVRKATSGKDIVQLALANPLQDAQGIGQAKKLLCSVTGGSKHCSLTRVKEIAQELKKRLGNDVLMVYGATCDPKLDSVLKVSFIITGMPSLDRTKRIHTIPLLDNDNAEAEKRREEMEKMWQAVKKWTKENW